MRNFVIVLLLLSSNGLSIAQQYKPTWESIDQRETPQWWSDAKFGIFIHWGPYSVPAYAPVDEVDGVYEKYAEHYESRLKSGNKLFTEYHRRTYGADFTYSDFAPMFNAEHFDPSKWADLFKRAGARYVVLTSKHHDGFCLWPSRYSPKWNSDEIGANRDLAGELTDAVRNAGLHMGFYYSLLEWSHPLYTKETIDDWVDTHMIPQLKELVDAYRPEIIFSDGEWDYPSETLKSTEFLAWLYNESPVRETVVVNDRWGKEMRSRHGDYYTTEYDLVHDAEGIGDQATHPWEESRGIGTSYGYNQFETTDHYFSSKQLVDLLIDKVSNGGNLLLNVGPKANGLIPVIMEQRLLDMGRWLEINGEAIYGTRAWRERPDDTSQPDVKYTRKDRDLYVICTKWPSVPLRVPGVTRPASASLLGSSAVVRTTADSMGVTIEPPTITPATMPGDYAWVFKLEDVF